MSSGGIDFAVLATDVPEIGPNASLRSYNLLLEDVSTSVASCVSPLTPASRTRISVNTRPVYIEGENGRRLVIVVSVLSTDLEEVTRRWCAYAPTLAPLRPTQKLTTIL